MLDLLGWKRQESGPQLLLPAPLPMPALAPEQIQELVDNREITALTLDTSIFDQVGCNLASKTLTALGQFKGSNIKVVLSSITLGEVRAHIAQSASASAEKARAAINQYLKAWRSDQDRSAIAATLGLNNDAAEHARNQVSAFCELIRAIEVPVEPGVSVAELTRLYFSAEVPFSSKDGKKSEFPDAIALLSLEAWAEKAGGYVLAVSKDTDWSRYAEKSNRIVCVKDLAASLNFFNTESSVVAARVASQLKQRKAPKLSQSIQNGLERYIENFEVEANSDFMYEAEPHHSQILSWTVLEDTTFDVVDSDSASLSLAFEVEVEAEFSAQFSFSVRDGVDRDYVSLGSASSKVTILFQVPLVVTLPKREIDDPVPSEVEIEDSGLVVDFDYVRPDWGDDE
ncbi:PIN domain-containing protein [Corallococcus sp. M7]